MCNREPAPKNDQILDQTININHNSISITITENYNEDANPMQEEDFKTIFSNMKLPFDICPKLKDEF